MPSPVPPPVPSSAPSAAPSSAATPLPPPAPTPLPPPPPPRAPALSPPVPPAPPVRWPHRPLAWLALLLWCVSLALPGLATTSGVWTGVEILMLGMPLGWLAAPGGLAALANLPFLAAVIALLWRRKKPGAPYALPFTLAALALACLAPMLKVVPAFRWGGDGVGSDPMLISWGWGAVMWGAALLIAALAAIVQATRARRARWAWAVVGLLVLALLPLSWVNWRQAAQLGQSRAMAPGMAFTTVVPLDGPVLTAPERPTPIPDGAMVALQIDPTLKDVAFLANATPDPSFPFPMPKRYQRAGPAGEELWQAYAGGIWSVQPVVPGAPAPEWRYSLTLAAPQRLNVSVTRAGQPVYEQQFMWWPDPLVRRGRHTSSGFSGRVSDLHDSDVQLLPQVALKRLRSQIQPEPEPASRRSPAPRRGLDADRPEMNGTTCPLSSENQDGLRNRRLWDGRSFVFPDGVDPSQYVGLCSERLLLLLRIDHQGLSASATAALDRQSLEPIDLGDDYWLLYCEGGKVKQQPADQPPLHPPALCTQWGSRSFPPVEGFHQVTAPPRYPGGSPRQRLVLHTVLGEVRPVP